MPLNLRGEGGSPPFIKFLNLGIRVLQMIFSATVIGIYATQVNNWYWNPVRGKMVLAETVGAMSLVTAAICAVTPFLLSYYFVAIAFIWDWILFFIWCAVFATMQDFFGNKRNMDQYRAGSASGVDLMIAARWIDLAAMLLFLVSGIMGPVCLLLDRKSIFTSRPGV